MKKKFYILFSLIITFVCLLTFNVKVFAASAHSSVLDDLSQDFTFGNDIKAGLYPSSNEPDIKVIQVAISEERDLFIYCYTPNDKIQASSIHIAMDKMGLEFKPYNLELLSSEEVFDKYKVVDYKANNDMYKYYHIASIYRPWDATMDEKPSLGLEVTEKAYTVGQTWRVVEVNEKVDYEMIYLDVLEITTPWHSTMCYPDGHIFNLFKGTCNGHFLAFSPKNRKIDRLMEATLSYHSVDVNYVVNKWLEESIVEKNEQSHNVKLSEFDKGTHTPMFGGFGKTYEWPRIQTVDNFLETEKDNHLTEEAIIKMKTYDFVLRFAETKYQYARNPDGGWGEQYTRIDNVDLLTLTFETDGKVYHLGVVGDKPVPDGPANNVVFPSLMDILAMIKDAMYGDIRRLIEALKPFLMITLGIVLVLLLWPLAKSVIHVLSDMFDSIGSLFGHKKNKY